MTTDDFTFRQDRSLKLLEIEQDHFWFRGRNKLVQWLLEQHTTPQTDTILDIGCGSGYTLHSLTQNERRSFGMDMHRQTMQRYQSHSQHQMNMTQADVSTMPFAKETFDTLLLLDVLEHVDDHALLQQLHPVLRPAAVIIASVPAVPFLWSFRDVDAGHLRRYTKAALSSVFTQAGFEIQTMLYYQFFLFPLVMVARIIGRFWHRTRDLEEDQISVLNGVFRAINSFEVNSQRVGIRYPFGSSLIIVARKVN